MIKRVLMFVSGVQESVLVDFITLSRLLGHICPAGFSDFLKSLLGQMLPVVA